MIIIVNYGMGNLGSVQNMLNRIGVSSKISSLPEDIEQAEKILLPGVGAFDSAMQKLNNSGLIPILNQKAMVEKVPILGICLGMQLLTNGSEEGSLEGLKWINAKTTRFSILHESKLKVPHMGWNRIFIQKEHPLVKDLPAEPRFYFVHSFKVQCENSEDVLATTEHGGLFHSVICNENILGAQFHPEKSHKFGMKLLENFARI